LYGFWIINSKTYKLKQVRKCVHKVTLRCFRATKLAVEKQKVTHIMRVCVCSLWHSAFKIYAPYCHVACPALHFFPHIVTNGTIFEKKELIEFKMCILIFSATFVRSISHVRKKQASYDKKCILVHYPLFFSNFN